MSAVVADAAADVVGELAAVAVAVFVPGLPGLPVASVAAGALAPAAVAATGMLAPPVGVAEKLLGGKGGRDGVPVDEVFVAAGLRGGSCDSRAILTLVCLLAAA